MQIFVPQVLQQHGSVVCYVKLYFPDAGEISRRVSPKFLLSTFCTRVRKFLRGSRGLECMVGMTEQQPQLTSSRSHTLHSRLVSQAKTLL